MKKPWSEVSAIGESPSQSDRARVQTTTATIVHHGDYYYYYNTRRPKNIFLLLSVSYPRPSVSAVTVNAISTNRHEKKI